MLTKPQFFYDHTTKQALGFQNPFYLKKAQQLEPKLYVGDIFEKTNPIVIPDSEETLLLAEESRSKMLLRQKDPIMLEKKVNTTPVDYVALNQLYKDFETRFVPQTELSAEQAFWSQNSVNSPKPILSSRPIIVLRATPTACFRDEHIKACFRDEIIPFVKALKDLFNTFNQYLVDELSEVQNVFHQMEQAVEQHRPTIVEVPKELPKVSMVNTSLKKLKHHLAGFDVVVKERTTPTAITEGVKPSTSASGSQPSGNTKKDKIRQTPSSTQKNTVEAHPRKVKSSLKNKDCVVEPKGTAHVQHSKLNAKSELKFLKEVKLKIFETEFWKKAPLLGELDLDIMKAFEREISKRLRHREQMRRWELFVNGRPILSAMKRQ
ncbi:hypothetical protein Tco_1555869 [Tanacetum coccineum]